jgi:hypothetical protein
MGWFLLSERMVFFRGRVLVSMVYSIGILIAEEN